MSRLSKPARLFSGRRKKNYELSATTVPRHEQPVHNLEAQRHGVIMAVARPVLASTTELGIVAVDFDSALRCLFEDDFRLTSLYH